MGERKEFFFIGVDVGTGSVRAALVNNLGKILRTSTKEIETWNPQPDFYEQSSENIWEACCFTIKEVCQGVDKGSVQGIGFDATCSLVVLDGNGKPVSVSSTGKPEQNIILWMDHRAEIEANEINKTGSSVLKYVGDKISLEMEIPKLLWLKKNLKSQCWEKAELFFDLPDFLTWKATGAESRSLCSLVCKWTYEIEDGVGSWNSKLFQKIGLEDLMENNFKKIGNVVLAPGTPCGNGLTEKIAESLGLLPGTPVGTSIIDAHAGGLGMIGCSAENISRDFNTRLGLICGTSTCHMAVSSKPNFVPGVWGPYYSAMVPGMWLNEGGQSSTGKLIDHVIETHPAYENIKKELKGEMHIQKYLSNLLTVMTKNLRLPVIEYLTNDIHVWPDFHGNRSPIADPNLKGMISGLTLSVDKENLAVMYLATVQALAYGTRHIMDTLKSFGYSNISSILICGGLSKNPLFIQTQADVVNLPVLCPDEPESVLLGSAILGACAAGLFCDMEYAMRSMAGSAKIVKPNPVANKYHEKKYKVFLQMLENQKVYKHIMSEQ